MQARLQMNRLFIILAAIAGITGVAWALRQPAQVSQSPAAAAPTEREVPTCCQKAPSRTSLLRAKLTAEAPK